MVRVVFATITILMASTSFAQEEGKYMIAVEANPNHGKGTIAASMTYSPSFMLNRDVLNYYLTGYLLYKLDNKFSIKGTTHMYLNAQNDAYFSKGFRTTFGAFYHFPRLRSRTPNLDTYIGLQPGVSAMARGTSDWTLVAVNNPIKVSPSLALTVGTTIYFWKYFNFFADLSYLKSSQPGFYEPTTKSDELMISAGLGFHFNTNKALR